MAYLDTNTQKPAGLIGALAIHGLIVAAALLVAPTVMRELPKVIALIDATVDKPKPILIEKPVDDRRAADDRNTLTNPDTKRDLEIAKPDSDLALPAGDALIGPLGTGGGEVVTPMPDTGVSPPVLVTARINPRFAGALQPTYPPGLIRQEIEGIAVVRVLVGSDGRVKDVTLIRTDHPDFFAATQRQALGKWRFFPATRDGAAIESWREMTVRFEIPD